MSCQLQKLSNGFQKYEETFIWFSHTFFTILPFLMQVSNFHDDETLPRSVKQKTDRESASQCETPPKKM